MPPPLEKKESTTALATFTTSLLPPPGQNNGSPLTLPTRTIPYPANNPKLFNDALAVRLEVFVDEQKCAADLEIDDDDPRSWQWVIYDDTLVSAIEPSTSIKVPVAVVRLVPPPHVAHEDAVAAFAPIPASGAHGNGEQTSENEGPKYDLAHEPYIKFGRVAVLSGYRGCGLARRLMETAIEWAEQNPGDINRAFGEVVGKEGGGGGGGSGLVPEWKGLALVHAQGQVERMYERLGFVTDEGLGRWVEEGIEHVGMWKRLDVKA
ncbi:acyl-CoA N-acyltransferase [Aspergillus cavernicola]|uniref:Glucosamine 6-phosphate N-acetyltransferase n=1 Tax=Aspergillus cavernicola TaxID=176166 RepID=A0ABR4IIK2_9EURO